MQKFMGFTNDQMFQLAQNKGYSGRNHIDDVNNFIMANEAARTYVTKLHSDATTLVGRQRRGFAPGGLTDAQINAMTPEQAATMVDQLGGANIKWDGTTHGDYSNLDSFKTYSGWDNVPGGFDTWKKVAEKAGLGQQNAASSNKNVSSGALEYDSNVFQYTDDTAQANNTANIASTTDTTGDTGDTGTGSEVKTLPKANYSGLATPTSANLINVDSGDPTLVGSGTGQITGDVTKPNIGTIGTPDQVDETSDLTTKTVTDVKKTATDVDTELDKLKATKGTVSDDAQADAVTMDQEDLGQLGLEAEQIKDAQTVKDPTKRTVQDDELVQSAYDKDKADAVVNATEKAYAQASPSTKAMVKGQLDGLMSDFEDGKTPPWAAGAMRTALAAMNARGLGASSMAGQAIVQAAMESALPIASADAQTVAKFEMQNLNNRQQAVILAAEQRATFLGQEFDMEFQARVKNATTISEIAKQNYDADVQIALENARMAQTVDIANLDAKNAKILSDAAALTKLDMTNLTNKQQAEVANAQAFLAMDLKNVDNEQQTSIFKSEAKLQALFKDAAADNAAKQFNAEQENQVNMFIEGLIGQQQRFNTEQANAMKTVQFQEDAALAKFFSSLKEQRSQFNATQSLAVSQANAKWYQDVTTSNNAAANQANMNDANNATAMTKMQLEQEFQADRDLMNWAFTADDNDKQRAASVLIAKMDADAEQANARGGIFQSLISGFVQAMNPLKKIPS